MTNDDQDAVGTPVAGAAANGEAPGPAAGPENAATQPLHGSRPGTDGQPETQALSPNGEGPAPSAEDADQADARAEADGKREQGDDRKGRKGSFWRELPLLIVIALVIALVVKTYVVQMFFIPSGSMQDTLQIGDRVMVNKLVYHFRSIQPGDIVVFNDDGSWNPQPPQAKPSSDPVVRLYDATVVRLYHAFIGMVDGATQDNGNILIKRVVGVPGDHVVCCNASGDLTVNGVPLSESSYLFPGNAPSSAPSPYAGHFSITVPAGRLWVMGDHRAISSDSRLHTQDPFGGTIPENMVVGRAFVIIWPPSRWRFLPIPATFGQPGINGSKGSAAMASAVPYLPLAAGFAGAFPLTLAQRRARRRVLPRRKHRG